MDELGASVSNEEKFLRLVYAEVRRAQIKFPGTELVMTALTEEVGELAKALLDESWENVIKEAIQVAAMAMRVAVEGDPSMNSHRYRHGLDTQETYSGNLLS